MKRGWLIFFCALCLCLFGCAAQSGGGDKPALPQPESTPSRTQGTSAAQLVPERLSKRTDVRYCWTRHWSIWERPAPENRALLRAISSRCSLRTR